MKNLKKGGDKMAIIRWDPFKDLLTLRERMNRLFEEAFPFRTEEREFIGSTWVPAVDIYEKDNELVLTAEVPGVKEDDIEIKIEDNTLILKGERKFERETKEENYHRIERSYGSFYRSFTLPDYVDQDKIRAEYENGVLRIVMPKREELKPRKIKVLKPSSPEKANKK